MTKREPMTGEEAEAVDERVKRQLVTLTGERRNIAAEALARGEGFGMAWLRALAAREEPS